MSFARLQRRVARCERLVQARSERTQTQWQSLKGTLRESLTPGRILILGVIGGVLAARARPLRVLGAVSATRWMQLAGSLSGLMASVRQAVSAAAASGDAAAEPPPRGEDTPAAARQPPPASAQPDADVPPPVSARPRRADPHWDRPPNPAEAATELSER